MSTPHNTRSLTAQEVNALHDLARRRALELRREAIGDFWRGADAVWAASLATTRRSAQRLAHRLARHAQLREAQPERPSAAAVMAAEPCQHCP